MMLILVVLLLACYISSAFVTAAGSDQTLRHRELRKAIDTLNHRNRSPTSEPSEFPTPAPQPGGTSTSNPTLIPTASPTIDTLIPTASPTIDLVVVFPLSLSLSHNDDLDCDSSLCELVMQIAIASTLPDVGIENADYVQIISLRENFQDRKFSLSDFIRVEAIIRIPMTGSDDAFDLWDRNQQAFLFSDITTAIYNAEVIADSFPYTEADLGLGASKTSSSYTVEDGDGQVINDDDGEELEEEEGNDDGTEEEDYEGLIGYIFVTVVVITMGFVAFRYWCRKNPGGVQCNPLKFQCCPRRSQSQTSPSSPPQPYSVVGRAPDARHYNFSANTDPFAVPTAPPLQEVELRSQNNSTYAHAVGASNNNQAVPRADVVPMGRQIDATQAIAKMVSVYDANAVVVRDT